MEDEVFEELSASLAEIARKKALEDEQKQQDALKLQDHDPDAYDAEGVLEGKVTKNKESSKTSKSNKTKQPKEQHTDSQQQSTEESAADPSGAKVQILNPRPFDINVVRPDYTMTFFGWVTRKY